MKKRTMLASLAALTLTLGGAAHADDNALVEAGTAAGRPAAKTVGVGIGSDFSGNDILTPNIASARFVISPTLMLEPIIRLQLQGGSVTPAGGGASASASDLEVAVGAGGRILLASRGPVDLNLLGRAMLSHESGDTVDSTQRLDLQWGLGVSWFFNQFCSLSLDAINNFVGFERVSVDNGPTTTQWSIGANFDPSVIAMLHVFL